MERAFPDGVVDYDGLKECELLERCIKETLRLRPPIMTMMRMAKQTVVSCPFEIHKTCYHALGRHP